MISSANTGMGGQSKWWLTVLSGPFYALLTVSLLGLGLYRFYELHTFTVNSIKTEGKIVDRAEIGTKWARTPITYRFIYTYSTRDGAVCRNQSDVDSRTYYYLKSIDSIPLKYIPAQPSRCRVDIKFEDDDEGGSAFFVCFLGSVFVSFGVWAYWYYLKKFSEFCPFAVAGKRHEDKLCNPSGVEPF